MKQIFNEIMENEVFTCLLCDRKFKAFGIMNSHLKNKHKTLGTTFEEYFTTIDIDHENYNSQYKNKKNEEQINRCLEKYGVTHTFLLPHVTKARVKALEDNMDEIVQKRKDKQTPESLQLANEKRVDTMLRE